MSFGILVRMSVEHWCRNPDRYLSALDELRHYRFIWDVGYCIKRDIDPCSLIEGSISRDVDYRCIVIWRDEEEAVEYGRGSKRVATYPVWSAYGSLDELEELCVDPPDEGEHRIVIIDLPDGIMRKTTIKMIADMQRDYPEVKLHVHGPTRFMHLFGLGAKYVSSDPGYEAGFRKLELPSGKRISLDDERLVHENQHWLALLNRSVNGFRDYYDVALYNIESALWAAEHFNEDVNWKERGIAVVDPKAEKAERAQHTHRQRLRVKGVASGGDLILCDLCSLSKDCKYYRSEGVCSVPESEVASLADMFKTRDSDIIINGLGELLARQTRRLEGGMKFENVRTDLLEEYGSPLDPEMTKLANAIFDRAVVLAKLVDPNLRAPIGRPVNVGVQVNTGAAGAVANSDATQLAAAMVAELEAQGIPRDRITPEMLTKVAMGEPVGSIIEVQALPEGDHDEG